MEMGFAAGLETATSRWPQEETPSSRAGSLPSPPPERFVWIPTHWSFPADYIKTFLETITDLRTPSLAVKEGPSVNLERMLDHLHFTKEKGYDCYIDERYKHMVDPH